MKQRIPINLQEVLKLLVSAASGRRGGRFDRVRNLNIMEEALLLVTPAKAGVQNSFSLWIPAFAGMTQ